MHGPQIFIDLDLATTDTMNKRFCAFMLIGRDIGYVIFGEMLTFVMLLLASDNSSLEVDALLLALYVATRFHYISEAI